MLQKSLALGVENPEKVPLKSAPGIQYTTPAKEQAAVFSHVRAYNSNFKWNTMLFRCLKFLHKESP